MSFKPLSRRTLLRGASGVAIALPMLEAMEASAQTASPPKRFFGFVSFDGTIASEWVPTGTETSFSYNRILQPLEPHKSKVIVVDGLDNEASYKGPSLGHAGGAACLLSGAELLPGDRTNPGWGGGISIDQEIARTVGKADRFPSLVLAVQPMKNIPEARISYSGPGQPVTPETSPLTLFNRVFGSFTAPSGGGTTPTEDPALAALRARRKSVLDAVKASYVALSGRVGASDRQKLDEHLTRIREIEVRVTTPPPATGPVSAGCAKPAQPASINYDAAANFPATGKLMIELAVMAMACNLTRSVTLQMHKSTSGLTFPWLGISTSHHDLSHAGDGDAAAREKLVQINAWYASQFAYLLAEMRKYAEGGGTLLDNSVVFWGNALSKGNEHQRRRVPMLIAGSAGGHFRTGRCLKLGAARPHNELLVSMLNAVGVPTNSFGIPSLASGPLANLT